MAQKVTIDHVDDLDGKTITDTDNPVVAFGLDGKSYEIDLSEKNQQKLRKALEPYIAQARKVRQSGGGRSVSPQSGPSPKEVREWARANGYEVPDRGRVPADVRAAFDNR